MTILFTGTSTADFQQVGGTLPANIITGEFNPDALEGIRVSDGIHAVIQLPSKHSELWIAYDLYDDGGTISTAFPNMRDLTAFYDNDLPTNWLFSIGLGYNSADGAGDRIGYWDGATVIHQKWDRGGLWNTSRARVDIHLKMADSGGVFECYVNGVLCAKLPITDTNLVGSSGIDWIRIRGYGAKYNCISGVIVADEDTRAMQFVALPPTAAGASSGWTGLYSDINETGYNDANLLTTNTLDAVSTFVTADLNSKFSAYKVKAVTIGARGIGGETAPTTIKGVVRTGGADFTADPVMGTPLALGPLNFVFGINPQTGNPWTYAEINAMEFGFKATA